MGAAAKKQGIMSPEPAGIPFGQTVWQPATAKRLGLESTLRRPGRPPQRGRTRSQRTNETCPRFIVFRSFPKPKLAADQAAEAIPDFIMPWKGALRPLWRFK
jgi:hypothetical protein